MSMQNPIADMLTRIRNAQSVKTMEVRMPFSKVKASILKVLKSEGYIANYRVVSLGPGPKKDLKIDLKYYNDQPVIERIRQISRCSRRVYRKSNELGVVGDGFGVYVISTSRGVMSSVDARKQCLGGEVLVEVY